MALLNFHSLLSLSATCSVGHGRARNLFIIHLPITSHTYSIIIYLLSLFGLPIVTLFESAGLLYETMAWFAYPHLAAVSFTYDCLSTVTSFMLLLCTPPPPHPAGPSASPTRRSISLITTTRSGLHGGFILLLLGKDGPPLQISLESPSAKRLCQDFIIRYHLLIINDDLFFI